MPYLVMEFMDRDFQIVETREKAEEVADYYQEGITEYANDTREWPTGSRIIIAELVENREIEEIGDKGYFDMLTEKF